MKFDLGHINKITVIHIVLTPSKPVFHFLKMKRKKDEIDFGKQAENIYDFDELIKKIGDSSPIILHFTGKGILNRKTVRQENYQHSILLNGNMDAFYFSDYLEDKTVFSSVIRKDLVDQYLNQFKEKKRHIISISSGPFHAAILSEALNKEQLTLMDIKLNFTTNQLVDFTKIKEGDEQNQRSIQLGDQRISNNLIPCAAAGAAFFNPSEKIVYPVNESVFEDTYEEAKQKNIFARFGMGMMLFFLVLLFANNIYLGQLTTVFNQNEVYLDEYREQLSYIADLEEEKQRKELLLQSSGLLNKNFLSFYLMDIANSVPNDIIFDEIILRPLKEEIKQRKKIAFEEHLVLVNGQTKTSHILSNWIEKIEQKEWLSKVDILSYEYVDNKGVFELEMIVY